MDEIINSFNKQKEQCADLQKQLQTFENRAEDFKHLDETVNDLNEQYPNLYYHARIKQKGVPHHFKAGNLAGGTNFVTRIQDGEGEFIAALDADMIPEPEWLRAIMAHMVIDDRMALVCPPQVRSYLSFLLSEKPLLIY